MKASLIHFACALNIFQIYNEHKKYELISEYPFYFQEINFRFFIHIAEMKQLKILLLNY